MSEGLTNPMVLTQKELLTLLRDGRGEIQKSVLEASWERTVGEWGNEGTPLPWSDEAGHTAIEDEDGVSFSITEAGGDLSVTPVIDVDQAENPGAYADGAEFAMAWANNARGVLRGLFERTDFPELEFKVLILWGPEWDGEAEELVTGDESKTTREIARLLYPDRPEDEVDIEAAMNTVRGKKGAIRERVRRARTTWELGRGNVRL